MFFLQNVKLPAGQEANPDDQSGQEETTTETTVDVSVTVTDGTDPVQGAIVTIGTQSCANGTGSGGGCTVKDVPIGEGVTVTVTCEGYEDYTATEDITAETTTLTIALTATQQETQPENP